MGKNNRWVGWVILAAMTNLVQARELAVNRVWEIIFIGFSEFVPPRFP